MQVKAVLDSDGLIKLAKAGVLEVVIKTWRCLIPRAVYAETVERGMRAGYPDALAIREALPASMIQSRVRDPRATALLEQKRGLGRGEREALHLFFAGQGDAIISDDSAFVAVLAQAGLPYLLPPLVLVQLSQQRQLEFRAALEGLERMRPFIRPEVYHAARTDLEAFRSRRPERTKGGASR